MKKIMQAKFPGNCKDCGAPIEVGDDIRYYGRGKVYGVNCHDRDGNRLDGLTDEDRAEQAERVAAEREASFWRRQGERAAAGKNFVDPLGEF